MTALKEVVYDPRFEVVPILGGGDFLYDLQVFWNWAGDGDHTAQFRAEVLEQSCADGLTERGYDHNGRAVAATCINALPEAMAAAPGVLIPRSFAPTRPHLTREG